MATRLVQALVIAVVALVVFLLVSWVRDATETAATVPDAAIGHAVSTAAGSSLRAAATALEAYRVENGTYAGATIPLLRQYDPSLDPALRLARADANGYCVETTAGATTVSLTGPGGAVRSGPC